MNDSISGFPFLHLLTLWPADTLAWVWGAWGWPTSSKQTKICGKLLTPGCRAQCSGWKPTSNVFSLSFLVHISKCIRFVRQFWVLLGGELCLSVQDVSWTVYSACWTCPWGGTRRNRVRPVSHTWSVHPQQGNHTSSGSNSISMSRWDLNFHTLRGLACYTVRSHGKSSFNIASGTFVGFQGRHDDFWKTAQARGLEAP